MSNTDKDNLPVLITGFKFNKIIPKRAESVVFTDIKASDGASLTDVSNVHDGSIVAWLNGTTYKVSTQKSGVKVFANPDSSNMFNGFSNTACMNLTKIDVTNLGASKATNMSWMFYKAGYQADEFNLDLSNWSIDEKADIKDIFYHAGHNATKWNIDCSSWILWNQISN